MRNRAKARAAAGSDARMNGCELPVVINSGSGNQGMTVSLPVIEYAKEIGADKDRLYRALIVSNLTAIHQKRGLAHCRLTAVRSVPVQQPAPGLLILKAVTLKQLHIRLSIRLQLHRV